MKRKIVKQGTATMTVSLPAAWIRRFNLREGNEIDIGEDGANIIISAEKVAEPKRIEIKAKDYGGFTKQDLSHLYILGYKEIVVMFDDSSVLQAIKERIPDCIGFEIFDQ